LLSEPSTSFVLVTAPRRDAVEEALYFAKRLEESHIAIESLVVNRLHPRFGPVPSVLTTAADQVAPAAAPLASLLANLRDLDEVALREESCVQSLSQRVATAPVARVPLLADDVHDLDGLRRADRVLVNQLDLASLSSAAAASSIVSATVTIRSKPVVRNNRVSVGRLQHTATSPPSSRARRIPPIRAPRPAESTNGTPDMSMSSLGLDATSASVWRN
jgi:hypothetical protein